VLVTSGVTSLATSAFIVTVSLTASPSVISPSSVRFPVASILPNTSKSLTTFTLPLPYVKMSRSALLIVVEILLSFITIFPLSSVLKTTV